MNVNVLNLMSSVNVQAPKVQSSPSNSSSENNNFSSFVKSSSSDSNKVQDNKITIDKSSNEAVDNHTNVNTNKDTVKIQSSNSNNSNKSNVDNGKNDDSKLETYLKEAGFTDEEIADIKEKIKNGSIDESSVFSLLSLLFGNNQDIQSKSNDFLNTVTKELSTEISSILKDKNSSGLSEGNYVQSKSSDSLNIATKELSTEISNILKDENSSGLSEGNSLQLILNQDVYKNVNDVLNSNMSSSVKNTLNKTLDKKLDFLVDILSTFDKSGQLTQKLSEKIADSIASKVSNLLTGSTLNETMDLKSQIYSELLQKLNPKLTNNLNLEKSVSGSDLFQIISQNRQMVENLDTIGNSLQNPSSNESSSDNTASDGKDTDILNKILGANGEDTKDSKISKAANFMTQFNNVKGENALVNADDIQNVNLNKATFDSDIIKTLKYMDLNNIKQLTVKISPKELGNITINLVMEDGKMKAVLTASNKDAYNLLNSNMQNLSNKLQNSDIKVQTFSLNLYHEDTTFFKNESNSNGNQNSGKNNKNFTVNNIQDEDVPENENDYYNDNNVNILA